MASRGAVIQMAGTVLNKAGNQTYPKRMTQAEKLTKWFLKEGRGGELLDKMTVVRALAGLVEAGTTITNNTLSVHVSNVRDILETRHGKTLWNIPGQGWKLANEKEKAIMCVRNARKTIMFADRTRRLLVCTETKEIPQAVKAVFGSSKKAQEVVRDYSKTARLLFGRSLLLTDGR